MNRWREAIASYERALALKPDYFEAKFALCMAQLPVLYADEAEIAERRAAYDQELRALCREVDEPGRAANRRIMGLDLGRGARLAKTMSAPRGPWPGPSPGAGR